MRAHPTRIGNTHELHAGRLAFTMQITEVPTKELRRTLVVTERELGSDAVEVRILRRELQRRIDGGKQAGIKPRGGQQ